MGWRRFYASPVLPVIGIIAIIVGILVGVFLLRGSTGRPRVNDHWHAIYEISVCGETVPPYPASDGTPGIHTHGDGLIHIHPNSPDDEGKNANLERFFGTVGVTFNSELLRLPDGRQFTNGDACPGGQPGAPRLMVGRTSDLGNPGSCTEYNEDDKFERYRPQQDDCVRVEFGPAGASPAATPPSTATPSPAVPPPASTPTPSPATSPTPGS